MIVANTAIIDPPWPYPMVNKHDKLSGYVCGGKDNGQYSVLSIDDMKDLPVGRLVNQYLLMWVVGPFIREALDLFDAWGFEYKSQMVWTKTTGLGVGYWFRGDHELVFVGKKPGVPSIRTNERSVIQAPRTRHSKKPTNLHELVERHFPGPYVELFAREARDGWTALGNQAPGDGRDIRETLKPYQTIPSYDFTEERV